MGWQQAKAQDDESHGSPFVLRSWDRAPQPVEN
jgi:hypothetical protein